MRFLGMGLTGSLAALAALAPFGAARAANYTSQAAMGAFVSSENFVQALDGQNKNDFYILSARFFLKATDVGSQHLELTADLRNKYDFFDNLNKEFLTLTGANTFQLRQLSARLPEDGSRWSGAFGRFPLSDAGAVNVDGGEVAYHWSRELRTAVFGGLNPRRPDQLYFTFNGDSQVFGTYTVYKPKADIGRPYFWMSNAAVAQPVQGHLDRLYWFNSSTYRWNDRTQVSALLYLDFTPRVYFQTAYLSWVQGWTRELNSTLNLFGIDVIEYTRRQGFLETLPPSAYKEANIQLQHRLTPETQLLYNVALGRRDFDGRTRQELSAGPSFNRFLSPHLSMQGLLGVRKNFTADEAFVRASLGYYSRFWEFTLDHDFIYQVETVYGGVYHPQMTELSAAHFFSRQLYATLTFQRASKETVDILAGYARVGFRFGSDAVPPLRDGAPPRGRL